jgi:hypothetical protein
MKVLAPISVGELVDKITILEIKYRFVNDDKRRLVSTELLELNTILAGIPVPDGLKDQLLAVNEELWFIENFKRDCERLGTFGAEFIEASRNVYKKNDARAIIKQNINKLTGSYIVEVKDHGSY